MDKAHSKTDILLDRTEKRLETLYTQTERKIWQKISHLLKELYLYNENATQKERIAYAEKDGKKDEIIDKIVEMLSATNKQSIDIVNEMAAEIYVLNGGDDIGN